MNEMAEKYYSLSQLMSIARDTGNQWTGPCMEIDTYELQRLKPADVRPVVRGEWVDKCVRDWHCSLCDYGIQKIRQHDGYIYKDLPNFCPNCGADMRPEGGAENGENLH